ncbi:MAG TPA: substrate-binding domain-containing protein [Polyangiaceae bacterium]|nr:substrate-binding domain-containing protein [Polyangiaceae bacterium]
MSPNRVREQRVKLGISQEELAKRSHLTRQSIFAIESGRSTPGVDVALRISAALDCAVEALFGASSDASTLATVAATPNVTGRVFVANVSGRWVSHAARRDGFGVPADGVVERARGRHADVALFATSGECMENVVVMGCASALGVLAGRLNGKTGPGRFVWLRSGSTHALDALAREQAHVAGVHLVDRKTGESNVPDVRRRVRGQPVTLVTLARWEMGLVLARGNPRRIGGVADVEGRALRVALREPGSGARRLWDDEARRAGLTAKRLVGRCIDVTGHEEVASAVAIGAADVGVATLDVALSYDLGFVALAEERYDLVVPTPSLADSRIARLLDVLTGSSLRRELSSLGYDTTRTGERVAELPAA